MVESYLPSHLEDKIFEVRLESDKTTSKIISYFPFSESEKQEIIYHLKMDVFDGFQSIFTDSITDEEWTLTKDQIKKKFGDELFDIDNL